MKQTFSDMRHASNFLDACLHKEFKAVYSFTYCVASMKINIIQDKKKHINSLLALKKFSTWN